MGKIYDKASIIVPQGAAYEATKIYAAKPLTDDASMEYIRSSAATRITDCGEIKEVPANVPQYDYIDGEPWLRLEKEATNSLFYSIPSTSQWARTGGATMTNNDSISPEGKINATKVDFGATGTNQYFYEQATAVGGNRYVASIYIKGTPGETFDIYADRWGSGLYWYFASAKTIIDENWNRYYFSFSVPADSNGLNFVIRRSASHTAGVIYAWGAQVEQGYIPTSLIKTTGSAATRYQSFYHNDDFKPGYEFKTTGWSYATKIKWGAELGNGGNVKRFADLNYSQVWYLLEPYNNNGTAYVSLSPVATVLASAINFDKFIVYRYNGTKLFIYNDGNLIASGTTAQTNDFVNKDRYGDSGFVGHIGDELYFNQCLSEDEAIELSLK